MRPQGFPTFLCVAAAVLGGCVQSADNPTGGDVLGTVVQAPAAAATDTAAATTSTSDAKPAASATTSSSSDRSVYQSALTGSVTGDGAYQLFDLGDGLAGDEWRVTPDSATASPFLVVVFNSEQQLLRRQIVTTTNPLIHILRADAPGLLLGVAPSYGSDGGSFKLQLNLRPDVEIPSPNPQVVWLDFDAGAGVRVQSRDPMSYAAFDAATLGSAYAGHTAEMRAAIVAAMRADYAQYNVVLLSSDTDQPPTGLYSTLYFGGQDDRLLGLADNVDQYNSNLKQTAVIYVDGFADFAPMRLSVEDMAQMIGNTASHELGHLLGLFHTADPVDLMDTTGSAWDLARDQDFTIGVLEPTVFPIGFENSPERLADAVGGNPAAEISVTKPQGSAKMMHKAELRALVRHELRTRCGNCLTPDP